MREEKKTRLLHGMCAIFCKRESWKICKKKRVNMMGISGEMYDEFRVFNLAVNLKEVMVSVYYWDQVRKIQVLSVHYIDERTIMVKFQGNKIDLLLVLVTHSGLAD